MALEKETLQPNRTIPCNGAYYFGSMRLTGCHNHATCRTVAAGIQNSCNAYFVTVFRELVDKYGFYNPSRGLDTLNTYLDKFGFGKNLTSTSRERKQATIQVLPFILIGLKIPAGTPSGYVPWVSDKVNY